MDSRFALVKCENLEPKNLKIKIYKIIISPFVLFGYKNWSLTFSEEGTIRVFENRVLMRIFEFKCDKLSRSGENYIMKSLMTCTPHPIFFG